MAARNFRCLPTHSITRRAASIEVFKPPEVKVPTKTAFLLFWVMLIKSPQLDPVSDPTGVHIPGAIALSETEIGRIQPSTVDEVELAGMID